MDGPQDLGGKAGFGLINPEVDEPLFHADWEKRALGITVLCGALGHWALDEGRHARESLAPSDYYSSTYYEIWIKALEKLLIRHGEITTEELKSAKALQPGLRSEKCLPTEKVLGVLASGGPSERPVEVSATYKVGDWLRTIKAHPSGHTRLPAYARDKLCVVEAVHGAHVFPDASAHGQGEQPQWLYTVAFEGTELWGNDSEAGLTVTINAWESYLERV